MLAHIISKAFPEWKVGEKIDGGSYGEVYEAARADYNTGEKAAIKIIPIPQNELEIDIMRSEGSDDNSIKKYFSSVINDCLDEITAMVLLESCPNVVNIKNYTVIKKETGIGGYIIILMELLIPFADWECDKHLSESDVIKLGCDICTALEACAEKNILHRDIKKSNILVTKNGDFKLTDFGIARKLENTTTSTLTQSTGTPAYIAPEVVHGTSYNGRVDIYSLGMVLFYLLNENRPPFVNKKQIITRSDRDESNKRRVINGEKLPPPCIASPRMAEIILRACAYDPKDRFSSATEMKQALIAANDKKDSYRYVDSPIACDLNDKENTVQNVSPQLWEGEKTVQNAKEIIYSNIFAKQNDLSAEKEKLWYQIEERYPIGSVVTGVVKTILPRHISVELEEDISGLIHKENLPIPATDVPSQHYSMGQKIPVKVLGIDKKKLTINLVSPDSYRYNPFCVKWSSNGKDKHLDDSSADPWLHAVEKYPIGTVVCGTVIKVEEYFLSIELEKGIVGYAHEVNIPKSRWASHNPLVKSILGKMHFRIGERVEVMILEVNQDRRQIKLSMNGIM